MIFSFLISNWSCVLYLAFSKMAAIWGRKEFFTWSDTGIWICYKDSHEHLWYVELLIDALAPILTELLEFKILTYFGTLWRHQWSNPRSFVKAYLQFNDTYVHLVWRWYLCKFFSYHEKCYFLFIKEYREMTLRSFSDVIDDVITMKIFFSCIIWDDLFISDVKLKLCFIFWHFQNGRYFELSTKFFYRKWHRKLNMLRR